MGTQYTVLPEHNKEGIIKVNSDFVMAIEELGREKGINPEVLIQAVEDAVVSAYKRNFDGSENVRVELNRETGEFHVYEQRTVVEELSDPKSRTEMTLAQAQAIHPEYQVGDVIENEVFPKDFSRIAVQQAKQIIMQRIREAERTIVYDKYSGRENDIVRGVVQRMERGTVYIDFGKIEGLLVQNEQIPGEVYRYHERIYVYIVEVKKTTKGPQIMLSRTHPGLIKRLFEMESPEIKDGVVEIKSVAREAGMRSKIAVWSNDENVDAVGACVGHRGARVQAVVDELKGEKIDIIRYSPEPAEFTANALSPAKVVSTRIVESEKLCSVIVPDYQLSLAIGKEGQNARLAAKLTGWKIDIKSESQAAAEEAERARIEREAAEAAREAAAAEMAQAQESGEA